MAVIYFMVQVLTGIHQTMPTIGVLICKCRDNRPRWIKPKRQRKA